MSLAGPGLFITRSKMSLDTSVLQDLSVNIVPERDPIPQLDKLEGLVQNIGCRGESAIECHSIYRTVMELVRSCGDPMGRGFAGYENYL